MPLIVMTKLTQLPHTPVQAIAPVPEVDALAAVEKRFGPATVYYWSPTHTAYYQQEMK